MGKPHRPQILEGQSVGALAQRYIEVAARALKQKNASAFAGTFTIANLKSRGLYEKEILMSRIEHLERPFPSSPKVPPKYIIRVTKGKSFNSEAFVATYAAQYFILAVINEREYKWLTENSIVINDDATEIKCEQGLEDIIEYKLKPAEREFTLPEPYVSRAHFLATGERHVVELPPNPIMNAKQTRAAEKRIAAGDNKPRPKPLTNRMRSDREGMVTIQDICATLKIEPRIARATLRKLNTPKPDVGWAWSAAEAKKIEAMIKKEIK